MKEEEVRKGIDRERVRERTERRVLLAAYHIFIKLSPHPKSASCSNAYLICKWNFWDLIGPTDKAVCPWVIEL